MERLNRIACHVAPERKQPELVSQVPVSSAAGNADLDVVIVGMARTPIGSFQGALSPLKAPELGAHVIKGALARANVPADKVEEVFMGNVLSAGQGQAPARQAALKAGVPLSVPCTTVNKVCSSGMKAIMFGAQAIALGYRSVVVCGGMESMSNVPYYLPKARTGLRMGNSSLVDGMINDGLWDVYNNCHMGMSAEKCSTDYKFSRKDQDDYTIESYKRAIKASKDGSLREEILPISVKGRRKTVLVSDDEEIQRVNFDRIPKLKPAFKRDGGSVTAANASVLSDGAAALVLMSRGKARELGCKVLCTIRGYSDAAQAPMDFPTAPALAVPMALKHAGVGKEEVDIVEINEAFSVVALANMKLLGLRHDQVNVYGGGVSIGHPIGCSGARIVMTLLSALKNKGKRVGVAGICNGGGGASAMVVTV